MQKESRHHQPSQPSSNRNKKTDLALATKILQYSDAGPKFDGRFHNCVEVGRLNVLNNRMCPHIAYATHQFARLAEDPRAPHGTVNENLVRYFAAIKNNELILDHEKT